MTWWRHIRMLGAGALVALLMFASSGQQVLRHYCHTAREHSVSLDAAHEDGACKAACARKAPCCQAPPVAGPHFEADCCAEHIVQLQLPDWLRPDETAPVWPPVSSIFSRPFHQVFALPLLAASYYYADRPPDRPAGKTLLLALRILRL